VCGWGQRDASFGVGPLPQVGSRVSSPLSIRRAPGEFRRPASAHSSPMCMRPRASVCARVGRATARVEPHPDPSPEIWCAHPRPCLHPHCTRALLLPPSPPSSPPPPRQASPSGEQQGTSPPAAAARLGGLWETLRLPPPITTVGAPAAAGGARLGAVPGSKSLGALPKLPRPGSRPGSPLLARAPGDGRPGMAQLPTPSTARVCGQGSAADDQPASFTTRRGAPGESDAQRPPSLAPRSAASIRESLSMGALPSRRPLRWTASEPQSPSGRQSSASSSTSSSPAG
jgi:hypothetical protein